ncbi:hypothetical protein GCM10018785_29400 [Streptomyces longispororuber]|uniref:Uncharacterized protein n=1 Tax=Streptomyces longispororuber TaxID=68230 RepID=A0A918ZL20_9ACTN|nr:hypothetical protein [Streptomyces longispororuber]GHE58318.1 hypothetical protein GCM10018785_29400 [Streptomyces longispororuber]
MVENEESAEAQLFRLRLADVGHVPVMDMGASGFMPLLLLWAAVREPDMADIMLRPDMAVFDKGRGLPGYIASLADPIMVTLSRPSGMRWKTPRMKLRPPTDYEVRQLQALAGFHLYVTGQSPVLRPISSHSSRW